MLSLTVSAEHNDLHAEADRPGEGTGTNVLNLGYIQWETGLGVSHLIGAHFLTLPTTLFRFGLSPWAEMRLEYTGALVLDDHPEEDNVPDVIFSPEPLNIGAKIRLWGGLDSTRLRWIPRTSLLLNLGLPLTKTTAQYQPISGTIDLLFENDLAEWLTIGYDLGVYWHEWAPTPDIFASLAFNFTPTDKLGVFVESYNTFDPDAFVPEQPDRTYTVYDINLDFGLTYMVHPHVQLDTYAGFNMYHSEPSLSSPKKNVHFGLGITWLLFAPH